MATLLGMICIFAGLALMVRTTSPPSGPNPLEQIRAADQAALHSFGWIDREKGVVRIPIDLAMEKVIREGTQPTTKGSP